MWLLFHIVQYNWELLKFSLIIMLTWRLLSSAHFWQTLHKDEGRGAKVSSVGCKNSYQARMLMVWRSRDGCLGLKEQKRLKEATVPRLQKLRHRTVFSTDVDLHCTKFSRNPNATQNEQCLVTVCGKYQYLYHQNKQSARRMEKVCPHCQDMPADQRARCLGNANHNWHKSRIQRNLSDNTSLPFLSWAQIIWLLSVICWNIWGKISRHTKRASIMSWCDCRASKE